MGHLSEGELQITVNGQVRQQSNLNLMIWDVPHIINHLSQQVTLEPGDLIYTGTPEGVVPGGCGRCHGGAHRQAG